MYITYIQLFQTTKIQIFESNSQPPSQEPVRAARCFRLQRYKFLKAIHNRPLPLPTWHAGCFRLQRYKFLKAIHNHDRGADCAQRVVSDYKDTNF